MRAVGGAGCESERRVSVQGLPEAELAPLLVEAGQSQHLGGAEAVALMAGDDAALAPEELADFVVLEDVLLLGKDFLAGTDFWLALGDQ